MSRRHDVTERKKQRNRIRSMSRRHDVTEEETKKPNQINVTTSRRHDVTERKKGKGLFIEMSTNPETRVLPFLLKQRDQEEPGAQDQNQD
ncbi:hypothetical protein NQZ68_025427 [Dissostichus eleginoides]|nr:hypothetical protein NQZ68_025427 [Dissostichus eleginoides]